MKILLLVGILVLAAAAPPVVAAEDEQHCALPITAECIKDWIDAAFDGRWVRIVCTIVFGQDCIPELPVGSGLSS